MSEREAFRRFDFRAPPFDPEELDRVVQHLKGGGLVAYPTETVYGFGSALRPDSLRRLGRLKNRGQDAPFLLLISGEEEVADLAWTPEARELAEVFWPGALTLVLGDPQERYPAGVRGPGGGVAVRRSPHPVARALVERLAEPLTSTSANPPGGDPAATADDAADAARAMGVDDEEMWILDGGPLPPSPPSTIVDLTGEEARVIREGAVPARRLSCAGTRIGPGSKVTESHPAGSKPGMTGERTPPEGGAR